MLTEKLLAERESLQNRLKEIHEIEVAHKTKKVLPRLKKELEGKYFKYLNSYGNDSPKWFLYLRINKVTDVYIYSNGEEIPIVECWQFQNPEGRFEIEVDNTRTGLSGYEEITKREFYSAYNKMIKEIEKIPV